jgi:hypothetical protein
VERDDDRARAQPGKRLGAVGLEWNDRIVNRDARDRQFLSLRVRDPDLDLSGLEFDAPDVELVPRRRRTADEIEQRSARGREQRDNAGQKEHRHKCPRAAGTGGALSRCGR